MRLAARDEGTARGTQRELARRSARRADAHRSPALGDRDDRHAFLLAAEMTDARRGPRPGQRARRPQCSARRS